MSDSESMADTFVAAWRDLSVQLHTLAKPHSSGHCVVCRETGVDVKGERPPEYVLDMDAIVPLHVMDDALAKACEATIGLWALEVGAPDITVWPEGCYDLVLRVLAHQSTKNGRPVPIKALTTS